jgi:hypothetical protein
MILFSESDSLKESYLAEIKELEDKSKVHMGEDCYQKEFQIGTTLSLEQAVTIALSHAGKTTPDSR